MGFRFYELSGGAGFQPEQSPVAEFAAAEMTPTAIPFNEPQVARAAAFEILTDAYAKTHRACQLRAVFGNRVNMCTGPGTNCRVLDKLVRGTQAEVIEVTAASWARIRVEKLAKLAGWQRTCWMQSSTCQSCVMASNRRHDTQNNTHYRLLIWYRIRCSTRFSLPRLARFRKLPPAM